MSIGGRPFEALKTRWRTNKAKGAIVASLSENIPEEYMSGLMAKGIAPLCGITEAFDAAEAAAFIGKAWKMPLAEARGGTRGASRSPHTHPG